MESLNKQIVVAFVFGVIFIATMIVLAIAFPEPTPFQERTFKITLSLAAAGVAAMIPGFINVELTQTIGVIVRAGGALAVFAIVFFFNPAQLVVKDQENSRPLGQVGAICYRLSEGSVEFLLVQTTGGRWTFPKGNINKGEERWFSAKKGAFQEAGASGEIDHQPLTTYLHEKKEWKSGGKECNVEAFLLRVDKTQEPEDKRRNPKWFSAADAKNAGSEGKHFKYAEEFKRVVDEAVNRIKAFPGSAAKR